MDFSDAVELQAYLARQFAKLRGSDPDRNRKAIPRTMVADIKQLVGLWDAELSKASSNAFGAESERRRWRECKERVTALSRGRSPADVYPDNASFWRCMTQLAIYLESEKVAPSRWQLFREAVEETVDNLPERVEHIADGWSKYIEPGLWIAGGLTAIWLLTKE